MKKFPSKNLFCLVKFCYCLPQLQWFITKKENSTEGSRLRMQRKSTKKNLFIFAKLLPQKLFKYTDHLAPSGNKWNSLKCLHKDLSCFGMYRTHRIFKAFFHTFFAFLCIAFLWIVHQQRISQLLDFIIAIIIAIVIVFPLLEAGREEK